MRALRPTDDHPARRRRGPAVAIVLGGVALGLVPLTAGPAGAATAPRSWSAVVDPVLSEDDYAGDRVVADGRVWSLEVAVRHRALLRSRSLRTGRLVSSVRVAIPLLRGAEGLGGGEDLGPTLVVAGGHAAAVGTWCGSFNDEERGGGDGCEEARSFFAVFSTRTGRVLRGGLTETRRRLVAGDRPAEVEETPGRPTKLRDVVSRRTLMTVPRSAFSIQGAGRYVSWKTGGGPESWTRMHVRPRGAARDRYVLPLSRVTRAIGGKDPIVQSADLTAGGSVDLDFITGPSNGHAVAVDGQGRLHRLPVSLSRGIGFETRLRGDRLLLDLASNERRCARSSAWLTDLRGRVGNHLTRVPVTRGRRLKGPPEFLPGGALSWEEGPIREDRPASERIRVVPDVRDLPLTRAQRPGC